MSAVRTMQSLSLLSSIRANVCALVKFGFGELDDLRTLLISALSFSASCWLSVVHAVSMAVMYSKLGGCLGVTIKLGPLARTDLCVHVIGLVDKWMTHLGLGSSMEEPWGMLALLVEGGSVAFLGTGSTCLGSSAVLLGSLGSPKPVWAPNHLRPGLVCQGDIAIQLGSTTVCPGSPKPGWVSNWLPACLLE